MHYGITVFGVKDSSENIINYIQENLCGVDLVITVSERVKSVNEISGVTSALASLCASHGIPLFEADSYKLDDEKTKAFVRENTFDLGIVVGWQRLIPKDVLDAFGKGVFGFHGNAGYLPFGRGRSPLNWSILLGDTRFNLNLFRYDEFADSPNVFATEMFSITPHDDIRTAGYKNMICVRRMVKRLVECYEQGGEIPVRTESKDFDSWYEKRTPADGKIDFHARTREIHNLIRAVAAPFPGAWCHVLTADEYRKYAGEKPEDLPDTLPVLKVWAAKPFDEMLDFSMYAPGEIIDVFDNRPVVRTVDGSLLIDSYEPDLTLLPGMVLA